MNGKVKRIDIKEFREIGYLQELNRMFLHPLGLALEVIVDEDSGAESLGGIWDYREDQDGMRFAKSDVETQAFKDKAERIRQLTIKAFKRRQKILGYDIQPLVELKEKT